MLGHSSSAIRSRLLLLLFCCAAALLGPVGCKQAKKPAEQELTVEVATVQEQDVPIFNSWVGTTSGYQNAEIRARVQGYLMSQDYQEGSYVTMGTVLFKIDPRPFEAALAQAQAELAQSTANADLARTTLARQTELYQKQVISQQEFDTSTQKARADLAAEQAAQANVQAAQLNLEFCTITAPLNGIVGKAEAQIGDLVGPSGTSQLTTMSQVDPMKVFFQITEQEYIAAEQLLEHVQKIPMEQRQPILSLTLSDGSIYPQRGKFEFANRQVDDSTGSLLMAGEFPNPNLYLRPGQYGKVRALTNVWRNALLIPQRAVMDLQGLSQVAVVGDDNKVQIQTVQLGPEAGSYVIVASGLKAGDRVITEGTQQVKNGMTVKTEPFQDQNARPVPTVPPSLESIADKLPPMSPTPTPGPGGGTPPPVTPSPTPITPTPTPTPLPTGTPTPAATPAPAGATPTP